MHTAFIVSREIFNHPIMKNIVDFRLFFLIFGKANHSEKPKHVVNGIYLERGQWFRSTRKLTEDLEYIENNKTSKYSTSVINYSLKRLSKYGMIEYKNVGLGTLFTVVNYNRYQDLSNYGKGSLEHSLEHTKNTLRTDLEQTLNNINNVINENNENNKNNKNITVVAEAKPKRVYKSKNFDLSNFDYDKYNLYESEIEYLKKFIDFRKDVKKKPLTEFALNLIIKQMFKIMKDRNEFIPIIEQSIRSDWQDVFPLKDNNKNNSQSKIEMANAGRTQNIQNTLFLDGGL